MTTGTFGAGAVASAGAGTGTGTGSGAGTGAGTTTSAASAIVGGGVRGSSPGARRVELENCAKAAASAEVNGDSKVCGGVCVAGTRRIRQVWGG